MTAHEIESMKDILDGAGSMTLSEYSEKVRQQSLTLQSMAECQRGEGIPCEQVMKEMSEKWLRR